MATALLRFTQGPHTAPAGVAVLGTRTDGAVAVQNGNNTGVTSWKIYLLDAPVDSAAFPLGTQPRIVASGSNASPAYVMPQPDAEGTYRFMLEVNNGEDRDIRCFGVPDARGFVRPPYQKNPDPLPVVSPVIISSLPRPTKPDEQNYDNNVRGWVGDNDSGQLDDFFKRYDHLPRRVLDSTPVTLLAAEGLSPLYYIDFGAIAGNCAIALPAASTIPVGTRLRFTGGGAPNANRIATLTPAGGGTFHGRAVAQVIGDSSLELVHDGDNNWTAFGCSRQLLQLPLVSGLSNAGTNVWQVVGIRHFDPRLLVNQMTDDVLFTAACFTTDGADAAQIRLFDVDAAAVVASSTLSFPELSATTKSVAVALPAAAHTYEAQLRLATTGAPNRAFCAAAYFGVDWLQT